jgi:mono/diheme cytochrome c family protein
MKKYNLNQQNLNQTRFLQPALGLALGLFLLAGCSSGGNETATQDDQSNADTTAQTPAVPEAPAADEGKGVGPVTTVNLGTGIDQALADKGKAVFEAKCTACHKFGERYVGPDLAGVTERRKPEWIMNMVLNPENMVQQDPTAKELLGEFMTQMPNQNLTQEEARAVLEYFRTKTETKAKI